MFGRKKQPQWQNKLPKVINPTTHGMIDYGHALFFFTMGLLCRRKNPAASTAAFTVGSFVLMQSLLTDYRFGWKPLFSFETHGKMDTVMASSSWMVPLLFGFRGTGAAKVFEVNSLVESSIVGMTQWDSELAHEEREAA